MESGKIMIVDDNAEFLEEMREMLYLGGYEPVAIKESSTALYAARKLKPDLILLDLKMNKMNGFDVAQKLKAFPETKNIPIIAMSGYFPVERNPSLLDTSSMAACLKKPFAILDLISQIEELLNGR
ncbi:MAG: response regulator [Candidatus Omnitrophota bacterium]